ncbi:MAG: HaeII family restriction endonuclease [Xenococcaceae cyanobacterium]
MFKAVENHNLEYQINKEIKSFNDRFIQVPLFQINDMDITAAKTRLDSIIKKTRTRYYKPIQIAEVLYRSRVQKDIDITQLETYRTKSKKWRDEVSKYLLNQTSSSSSRFQDDIWNNNAMPPEILTILDRENKELPGVVERYIYYKFIERQSGIIAIFEKVKQASTSPATFNLTELLTLFRSEPGLKRSIDKCYEIVTYSLFETIVTGLETEITIKVSQEKADLLKEFEYLAKVLLNIDTTKMQWSESAHIYRVGVTNAADRGLDMWANFGPAIQVKHLTLDENAVREIVEGIESERIIVVCRDIDASIIEIIIKQIGWGKRVQGIIKESDLIKWYERACKGNFAQILAPILMKLLIQSFESEFPEASNQANKITEFCREREYDRIIPSVNWPTKID